MVRIKEIYIIMYGKNGVSRSQSIGKEFVEGIVVEIMKGKKISWVGFGHETQRSKWLSRMEKCIEKKANLEGKIVAQMKTKLGVVDVMKGEKKVK